MGELPELTAELLRAKVRHRAGRYLTQLGAQRYDTDRTYAQWAAGSSGGAGFSGAPFEAQVAEWTNRLQDELSQAANRLNAARSAVLESCWAADAVASPPAASAGGPRTAAMPATMGRYGRAMAELLTAGMDSDPLQTSGGAAGSLWRSDGRLVGSSEDEALNSAGMVMCSTLPALVLGDEGLEPWEVRWWRDEGAVGACFPEAPRQQWGGLRDLLEPSGSAGAGPRPLDALRLLSSWGSPRQGLANVPECGRRVAALHRSLHNLAAFYYDSPLFARSKAADPGCRFEGAGAAAGAGAGAGASACPGVTALCGGLQGTEDPDALGGGQLSFATAGLLTTESLRRLLASRGETDADLELDVALARALATNKEQVCWSTQWSDVERDEDGRLVSCPSFCNRDMRVPWLTSQDPGRSQCGTAWAMFSNDDSLGTILTEWPPQAERKYCREPPAVAPDSCRIEIGGKRVSTDNREHLYCEACCCGDGESEDCTYRGALPEAHRLCDFPATA